MKKVGDMMKDLGFKEGASEETTKAFIKNLIRQAYGVEVKEAFTVANPSPSKDPAKPPLIGLAQPEQLAFDLGTVSSPSSAPPQSRTKKLA